MDNDKDQPRWEYCRQRREWCDNVYTFTDDAIFAEIVDWKWDLPDQITTVPTGIASEPPTSAVAANTSNDASSALPETNTVSNRDRDNNFAGFTNRLHGLSHGSTEKSMATSVHADPSSHLHKPLHKDDRQDMRAAVQAGTPSLICQIPSDGTQDLTQAHPRSSDPSLGALREVDRLERPHSLAQKFGSETGGRTVEEARDQMQPPFFAIQNQMWNLGLLTREEVAETTVSKQRLDSCFDVPMQPPHNQVDASSIVTTTNSSSVSASSQEAELASNTTIDATSENLVALLQQTSLVDDPVSNRLAATAVSKAKGTEESTTSVTLREACGSSTSDEPVTPNRPTYNWLEYKEPPSDLTAKRLTPILKSSEKPTFRAHGLPLDTDEHARRVSVAAQHSVTSVEEPSATNDDPKQESSDASLTRAVHPPRRASQTFQGTPVRTDLFMQETNWGEHVLTPTMNREIASHRRSPSASPKKNTTPVPRVNSTEITPRAKRLKQTSIPSFERSSQASQEPRTLSGRIEDAVEYAEKVKKAKKIYADAPHPATPLQRRAVEVLGMVLEDIKSRLRHLGGRVAGTKRDLVKRVLFEETKQSILEPDTSQTPIPPMLPIVGGHTLTLASQLPPLRWAGPQPLSTDDIVKIAGSAHSMTPVKGINTPTMQPNATTLLRKEASPHALTPELQPVAGKNTASRIPVVQRYTKGEVDQPGTTGLDGGPCSNIPCSMMGGARPEARCRAPLSQLQMIHSSELAVESSSSSTPCQVNGHSVKSTNSLGYRIAGTIMRDNMSYEERPHIGSGSITEDSSLSSIPSTPEERVAEDKSVVPSPCPKAANYRTEADSNTPPQGRLNDQNTIAEPCQATDQDTTTKPIANKVPHSSSRELRSRKRSRDSAKAHVESSTATNEDHDPDYATKQPKKKHITSAAVAARRASHPPTSILKKKSKGSRRSALTKELVALQTTGLDAERNVKQNMKGQRKLRKRTST